MKTTNTTACNALAHYLDLDPSTIHPWHHLELDLYLSPGDLALVAQECEEVEDVRIPVEQLMALTTVGDLQSLLARTVARDKPIHSYDSVA